MELHHIQNWWKRERRFFATTWRKLRDFFTNELEVDYNQMFGMRSVTESRARMTRKLLLSSISQIATAAKVRQEIEKGLDSHWTLMELPPKLAKLRSTELQVKREFPTANHRKIGWSSWHKLLSYICLWLKNMLLRHNLTLSKPGGTCFSCGFS